MESLPDYCHEPLPPGRFVRIVEILPSSSEACDHPWSIAVSAHDLDSDVSFTALSYTWGHAIVSESDLLNAEVLEEHLPSYLDHGYVESETGPESFEIECNSCRLSVTKNLFDYLDEQHRRNLSGNGSVGKIWIDAVCINQNDTEERNAQVAMMGEIYSAASDVVIWLGKNITDVEKVLAITEGHVYDALVQPNIPNDDNISVAVPGDFRNQDYLQSIGINMPLKAWDNLWNGFLRFFQMRRYFNRAWVFQECALAQNLKFRCGCEDMSFARVRDTMVTLQARKWLPHVPWFPDYGLSSCCAGLLSIGMSFSMPLGWQIEYPTDGLNSTLQHRWYAYLSHLLAILRTAECEDPRDKVYALIGLANKLSPERQLVPDYKMNVRDVYLSIASELLLNRPGLITLYHCGISVSDGCSSLTWPKRPCSLPSWVPDFATPGFYRAPCLAIFNASGSGLDEKNSLPVVTQYTLTLRGARFDEVVHTTIPFADQINSVLEILVAMPETYIFTQQPSTEVLSRLVIMDTEWTIQRATRTYEWPASRDTVNKFAPWILTLTPQLYQDKVRLEQLKSVCARDSSDVLPSVASVAHYIAHGDPSIYRRGREFQASLTAAGSHRRAWFLTKSGCLGVGPFWMQEGDDVFLLMGAKTPFILRKTSHAQNYTFVGWAYVHGFMQGEMLEELRDQLGPVHIV